MKHRNLITAAAFFLLQFVLFSCQKEHDVEPVKAIIPLQVGNEWNYLVSDYNTEGKVVSTSTYRRAVVKDTVINKSTWYKLSDGSIVQNSREGYVYFNHADKEGAMLYQNESYGGIGYAYKYPGYDLWVLTTRTYELAPVENNASNFLSYVFSIERQFTYQGSTSTSSTWQKDYVTPEIGMVRSDRFFADSDKILRRYELISYILR